MSREPSDRVKINNNIFHKSVNHLPFIRMISITGHIYRKMILIV